MKKIVLLLSLLLILTACCKDEPETDLPGRVDVPTPTPTVPADTDAEKPDTDIKEPQETAPEEPENEPEKAPQVEPEKVPVNPPVEQEPAEPTRTPEQELVDKELVMLLREQLAGAYDTKGAEFTYVRTEELESKECFVYEMKKDGVSEIFAVAVDSSAIFHLEDEQYVKIFG